MKTILAAAAALTLACSLTGSPAEAARVRAGTLSCNIAPSVGFVVGSRQTMTCRFLPSRPGPTEVYSGTMTRIGLDLGVTAGARMVWGVFIDGIGPRAGILNGNFVGASGDAAIGVGLGANVLVGGSNRGVALQPLSVEGQVGLNLALGVADLRLTRIR